MTNNTKYITNLWLGTKGYDWLEAVALFEELNEDKSNNILAKDYKEIEDFLKNYRLINLKGIHLAEGLCLISQKSLEDILKCCIKELKEFNGLSLVPKIKDKKINLGACIFPSYFNTKGFDASFVTRFKEKISKIGKIDKEEYDKLNRFIFINEFVKRNNTDTIEGIVININKSTKFFGIADCTINPTKNNPFKGVSKYKIEFGSYGIHPDLRSGDEVIIHTNIINRENEIHADQNSVEIILKRIYGLANLTKQEVYGD